MVKVKEDLTGRQFGKWKVLKQVEDYIQPSNGKHHDMWLCECDCELRTIKAVQGKHLKNGKSTKCIYCSRLENSKRLVERNKSILPEHLKKPTSPEELALKNTRCRIYTIWNNIKRRCNDENSEKYPRYGGRGIKICNEWYVFDAFYEWALNNGYKDNLSIDRMDNDGNYEPNNCRWVDDIVQANNKSTNHLIEYNGETHTLQEWSRIVGIDRRTIWKRIIQYGWSVSDALEKPIKKQKQGKDLLIEFKGETHNLSDWSKILSITRETLKSRFKMGWSIEKAFTTPP